MAISTIFATVSRSCVFILFLLFWLDDGDDRYISLNRPALQQRQRSQCQEAQGAGLGNRVHKDVVKPDTAIPLDQHVLNDRSRGRGQRQRVDSTAANRRAGDSRIGGVD